MLSDCLVMQVHLHMALVESVHMPGKEFHRETLSSTFDLFQVRFGRPPDLIARSPGRVNLIGDHTDYNLGFSLSMAIEQSFWLAAGPRRDRRVNLHSELDASRVSFNINSLEPVKSWGVYVQGIARAFDHLFPGAPGWDGLVIADLPVGAGLSSSAALEMVTARVFAGLAQVDWDPLEMARIGWRAENEWVGIESGPLDQISSAAAIAGHLMLIDFRSLEVQQVEFPSAVEVLIFDSSLRRELTSTAYNDRRAESFDAARILGVDSLRDASLRDLDDSGLSEMLVRRVRHVLNENRMVHDVVDDLGRGDFRAAGQALAKSHQSLRDDYETSVPEIDLLVELANGIDGCHGARMTGGGFGGSVVALVEPTASLAIASTILGEFEARSGLKASVLTATPQAGTSVVYP